MNSYQKARTNIIVKILFLFNDFIIKAIDHFAITSNNGIHPKHELTKYYEFFTNNITRNDNVLDIGCGTGFVASAIAKKALFVTGVDFSEKSIAIAKNKFKKENIEFLIADATEYSFKNNYDAIILSNVLEHIENRIEFLGKIKSLSHKILIRVPMVNRDWLTLYKKELGLWYYSDPTHFTEYTIESFRNEMISAGLIIDSHSVQFGEIWAVIKSEKQ